MSRAYGHIAQAVAAVIAEQVHKQLHRVPSELAAAIGRDSVAALLADGWYIAAMPPTPPTTTHQRSHSMPVTRDDVVLLAGLARGLSSNDLARDMAVTPDTVKDRIRSLSRRTKAQNGAHLVALGYQAGILAGLAPEPAEPTALTDFHLRILQGLADGLDYAGIGRRHYITENTVRTGARLLYRGLGITGTPRAAARAVALGYQHGHLKPNQPGLVPSA